MQNLFRKYLLYIPLFSLTSVMYGQKEEKISFPMIWEEKKNGDKVYLNYIEKKEYNDLTDIYYTGIAGKRRWIGPDDLFLEYEMCEAHNQYTCLVWYIPEGNSHIVALKILSDKYYQEDKEWEKDPDSQWRILGDLKDLRLFNRLFILYKEITGENQPQVSPPSFPIIIDIDKQGNKKELYSLERKTIEELPEGSFFQIEGKKKKIQSDDLFLEYNILEAGNWYRCLVCFTNNGEENSRVYIRILKDIYWDETGKIEDVPQEEWRELGYLDEMPNFIHLMGAYRKYIYPLETTNPLYNP